METQQNRINDIVKSTPTQERAPSSANLHANPQSPPQPYVDPIKPLPSEGPSYTPPHKPSSHTWRSFLSFAQLIGGAIILAIFINSVVFQSYEVIGQSMVPTLQEGDRLIINKLGKSWSAVTGDDYIPSRGEIIVFHNPNNPADQLVKRVVGLPGDRVVVDSGNITIYNQANPDGFNYDDSFELNLLSSVGNVDLTVPDNELFVVGDNRGQGGSLDSRNELGTVPINQVVGDLVLRIFPVSNAALF